MEGKVVRGRIGQGRRGSEVLEGREGKGRAKTKDGTGREMEGGGEGHGEMIRVDTKRKKSV